MIEYAPVLVDQLIAASTSFPEVVFSGFDGVRDQGCGHAVALIDLEHDGPVEQIQQASQVLRFGPRAFRMDADDPTRCCWS